MKFYKNIGLSLLLYVLSANAMASIIDNGIYTTDTQTGFDWLDLTQSLNDSYDTVSTQFGAGEKYDGYRYATQSDVATLIFNITGVTYTPIGTVTFSHGEENLDLFITLLGDTKDTNPSDIRTATYCNANPGACPNGPDRITYGLALPLVGSTHIRSLIVADQDYNQNNDLISGQTGFLLTEFKGSVGSYLIRDSIATVPAPAAAWLVGSGLIGLIGMRKKSAKLAVHSA